MAKRRLGSAKRFGVRYGRSTRGKVAIIEGYSRKKHKCPQCQHQRVRRMAAGIWVCQKCGNKFAGRAFKPEGKNLRGADLSSPQKTHQQLVKGER